MDTLHYLNLMRKVLLPLPGVEEYTCFGTPAFRVKKKLLARVREDGETVAIHCDDRDVWIDAEPAVFFVTEHYFKYPTVLLKLEKASKATITKVLTEAWEQIAPKTILKAYLLN